MSQTFNSGENIIKLGCIMADHKHGTWWSIGTEKEWLEFRTTKAGKIRVIRQEKGQHPYFTLNHKETGL